MASHFLSSKIKAQVATRVTPDPNQQALGDYGHSAELRTGRGAQTGCGHLRPKPQNRRWRWGGGAPPRGGWLKTTRGKRVGRQGAPQALTARGLPAQGRSPGTPGTTDWRPPHGARAHGHLLTQSRSRPGRTLSRRVPVSPMALTRATLLCQAPRPAPFLRASRALLCPGTPPADGGGGTTLT